MWHVNEEGCTTWPSVAASSCESTDLLIMWPLRSKVSRALSESEGRLAKSLCRTDFGTSTRGVSFRLSAGTLVAFVEISCCIVDEGT